MTGSFRKFDQIAIETLAKNERHRNIECPCCGKKWNAKESSWLWRYKSGWWCNDCGLLIQLDKDCRIAAVCDDVPFRVHGYRYGGMLKIQGLEVDFEIFKTLDELKAWEEINEYRLSA